MDIQKLRDEIPVLRNLTYMNTGWSGPPPRSAAEAMQARVALEAEQGPTTPGVYESGREIQEEARRAAARLLGADVDETLVTRNTTEGLNIVLSGLDWRESDEIVTCNLEHGSVLAPSWHIAHRYGVNVRVLTLDPHDSHDAIVGKFEAALNERTRLIFVSHIEYSTGLRMPAAELCRVAHAHGAQIMLDGAQTGGHIALGRASRQLRLLLHPRPEVGAGLRGRRRAVRPPRADRAGPPGPHRRPRRDPGRRAWRTRQLPPEHNQHGQVPWGLRQRAAAGRLRRSRKVHRERWRG